MASRRGAWEPDLLRVGKAADAGAWGGIEPGGTLGRSVPRTRTVVDMDDYWVAVVWTLLPTVVVSALFFFILRSILRADRTERRVYARVEAQERAKRGLPPANTASEQ